MSEAVAAVFLTPISNLCFDAISLFSSLQSVKTNQTTVGKRGNIIVSWMENMVMTQQGSEAETSSGHLGMKNDLLFKNHNINSE